MNPSPRRVALVLTVLAVAGCTLNKSEVRRDNILTRVGNGQLIEPKRCALQIAFLTRPLRDEAVDVSLWNAADEQALPSDARRALEANGLRIGVITGALPADVESILNTSVPPKVNRTQISLEDGNHAMLPLSESTPIASLLLCSENRAYGKDYQDASGWCRVTAKQEGASGVALRFVPEIHHGPIQHGFGAVPNGGAMAPQQFRVRDGQEEDTLRELAAMLTLQPGQIAVVGCRPDKLRSIGTFLFTQPEANSDRLLQKVLMVWASRTTQGLPTLEPTEPPDMPQPQLSRQKTENNTRSASPKGDTSVQN